MYTTESVRQYLTKKFNLSESIIIRMQQGIEYDNITRITYHKHNDLLTIRHNGQKNEFHVRWWLKGIGYQQCTCCGNWYKPSYNDDSLSSSVWTIYSYSKGRDVTLPVCTMCTIEGDKVGQILSDCMEAYDTELIGFNEAFYPQSYVKT